jgi:hypothetical protein
MSIRLKDLKYFEELEEKCGRVTPEHIAAVERGAPFSADEPVVGVLPDAVIALLALYQQAATVKHLALARYLDTDPSSDTDGNVRHTLIEAHNELMSLRDIIRDVIKAEFPEVKRWRSFAYGPNFEVHHVTLPTVDDDFEDTVLAEILVGNTLDAARKT